MDSQTINQTGEEETETFPPVATFTQGSDHHCCQCGFVGTPVARLAGRIQHNTGEIREQYWEADCPRCGSRNSMFLSDEGLEDY